MVHRERQNNYGMVTLVLGAAIDAAIPPFGWNAGSAMSSSSQTFCFLSHLFSLDGPLQIYGPLHETAVAGARTRTVQLNDWERRSLFWSQR